MTRTRARTTSQGKGQEEGQPISPHLCLVDVKDMDDKDMDDKDKVKAKDKLPLTSASSMTIPVDLARARSAASRDEKWTKA